MNVSSHAFVNETPLVNKKIWAGVRLGTPGRNCKGSGICEVFELDSGRAGHSCGCSQTALIIARGKNYLEFKFLKSSLGQKAQEQYFQNGLFYVEEDLFLPLFLRSELKLSKKTLARGRYEVKQSFRHTSIFIQLK